MPVRDLSFSTATARPFVVVQDDGGVAGVGPHTGHPGEPLLPGGIRPAGPLLGRPHIRSSTRAQFAHRLIDPLEVAVFLEEAEWPGELGQLWGQLAACQPSFAEKVTLHPFLQPAKNTSCSPPSLQDRSVLQVLSSKKPFHMFSNTLRNLDHID